MVWACEADQRAMGNKAVLYSFAGITAKHRMNFDDADPGALHSVQRTPCHLKYLGKLSYVFCPTPLG